MSLRRCCITPYGGPHLDSCPAMPTPPPRPEPDWRSLCARMAEVMETVAAPLAINGPDHAAAVQHARDVLKDYAAATKTGQSAGGGER